MGSLDGLILGSERARDTVNSNKGVEGLLGFEVRNHGLAARLYSSLVLNSRGQNC